MAAYSSKGKEAESFTSWPDQDFGPSAPSEDVDLDLPPPYNHVNPPLLSTVGAILPETRETFDVPLTTTTEDQVHQALREFRKKKYFVPDLVIKDIVDENVYCYQLDTMYEKRTTLDVAVAWQGEPVDGPANGPPPGPWDIAVFPAEPFKDGRYRTEVPHTTYTRTCFTCQGRGRVNCTWCYGRGRCMQCHGYATVVCTTCRGTLYTKHFVQMFTTWTVRTLETVANTTGLPERKVNKADGYVVAQQRAPRVNKLTNFPSSVICETSSQLIDISLSQFPEERILEQRHSVKVVPVARVSFTAGSRKGSFLVYGKERRVYFPDGPTSCCIS
ncbi:Protein SSUH2 -like protein [Halotydeus destructor]|nr:Protein SSUH2 -like protein [Halotydeus destructor]